MTITHKINMDLTRRGIAPRIPTVQGDALTRKVEISLLSNGLPWEIPGTPKALLRYRRSDRTVGAYDTLADGDPAYLIQGNVITVTIAPDALTVPGDVSLIVTLISDEMVLSIFEIVLEVQPNNGTGKVSDGTGSFISGMIPGPLHAQEGQILAVDKLTAAGTVQSFKAIDPPDSGSIQSILPDDEASGAAETVYRVTMSDGTQHSFTVKNGSDGAQGKSAYEYARDGGYTGTEAEFAGKLAEEIEIKRFETENGSGGMEINIIRMAPDGTMECNGAIVSDGKSAYACAQDGGFTGTEEEFAAKLAEEMPEALPNPHKLILTGSVYAEYDGSGTVTVEIPAGGTGSETETVLSDNLLDKSLLTKGQVFYYGSSGFQLTESTYSHYGFIPLRGAGTYRTKFQAAVHASTAMRIALVNDDNEFVANATGTHGDIPEDETRNWLDFEFVVTESHIAAGVTKVAFDVYELYLGKTMIVKDREYPSEYIPYGYIEVATDSGKKQDNVLCGKTAVFLGDSICAGKSVSTDSPYYGYGWAGLIGEANHMTWTNYGKDGGTITHRGTDSTCIANIADTVIAEHPTADYVIFEGGCNDADLMRESGLGVISSDYATFDTTTFSGALESLILKLVTAYPSARIGYIIPQKMYTGYADYTGKTHLHRKYFDRAAEICQKWGISVVDIWNGSMLNPKLSTSGIYYVEENGQHLTEAGYLAITPMIESWMRNMYTPGAAGGVSSWNGLTDKPFDIVELLPETQFQYDEEQGLFIAMSDFEFVSGRTYIVSWNGVEYSDMARTVMLDSSALILIGNEAALGGEDNGLPFAIARFLFAPDGKGTIFAIPMDDATSLSVCVKGAKSSALYQQMDSSGPLVLDMRQDSGNLVVYATKEQILNAYLAGRPITMLMCLTTDNTTMTFCQFTVCHIAADAQWIMIAIGGLSSATTVTLQYNDDGTYTGSMQS